LFAEYNHENQEYKVKPVLYRFGGKSVITTTKSLALAQKEMRSAFLGGFAGQLVSGVLWLVAAVLSLVFGPTYGMLFLFFGCMFIFPLTQLVLRLIGRPAKVEADNGLWRLGAQVAFTVPVNFILVGAIILFKEMWFFPASMVIVGSHYLPFITLYGMKSYAVLAALLIVSGLGLALYGPAFHSLGGFLAGAIMVVFSLYCRISVLREERSIN